jgi:hypothetical protein
MIKPKNPKVQKMKKTKAKKHQAVPFLALTQITFGKSKKRRFSSSTKCWFRKILLT